MQMRGKGTYHAHIVSSLSRIATFVPGACALRCSRCLPGLFLASFVGICSCLTCPLNGRRRAEAFPNLTVLVAGSLRRRRIRCLDRREQLRARPIRPISGLPENVHEQSLAQTDCTGGQRRSDHCPERGKSRFNRLRQSLTTSCGATDILQSCEFP